MAQTKATKKFEKKHLKDVLKRRKEFAKVKQRHQVRENKRARTAKSSVGDNELAEGQDHNQGLNGNGEKDALAHMSVDDFFQTGVDIPTKPKPIRKRKGKTADASNGSSKRKLEDVENEEDSDKSSAHSVEQNPILPGSSPEPDSGDDEPEHREQLEALAEKDPSFYDFLKENDAELLDFANDADLAELDRLSGSDVDTSAQKKPSRRAQKTKISDVDSDENEEARGRNKVTSSMVKKWQVAMTEKHSLTATKEVVLAFRAAAHMGNDESKEFKYHITNPDGKCLVT